MNCRACRLLMGIMISGLLLSSCGGGGGGGSSDGGSSSSSSSGGQNTMSSGVFVDSPVAGLNYETATQSGTTDSAGTFNYMAGEYVTFSIGDIDFPQVYAASSLSPFDLAGSNDVGNISVINIARLLQSLDLDGDVSNGIEIGADAHLSATGVTLQFDDPDFDTNTDVINLVANSGSTSTTLIDGTTAINNLLASVNPDTGCAKTHARVGQVATLSTLAHNVSGTATIIDDCTIVVSSFNYDGGGPTVYFYGGKGGNYDTPTGFPIGGLLTGAYVDNTLMLTLPEDKSLDDLDGIAVWCADFKVDFGSGMFQ